MTGPDPAPDRAPALALTVNGEARAAPAGSTLRDLLIALGVRTDAVAVAINGEVVPRARHGERSLYQDDRVEIIRAVGGG